MIFRVFVQTTDASGKWEVPYSSFKGTEELNKDRFATISFDYQVVKAIADIYGVTVEYIFSASFREIYIKDEDGNTIYGGYISDLQFNRGQNNQGSISISSKGFFSLLARRYTNAERTYSSEDIATIIDDLLDYTQGLTSGNFGITFTSVPTTRDMDRTFRYKNIAEAIEKMSNNSINNGVDFEVDNSKNMTVWYPERGSVRSNFILEENFNIETYQINKIFIDGMTNQAIVIGAGQDETNKTVLVRDSEAIYKSNFYLLQSTLNESDVSELATLQDKGDKYLTYYKAPRYVINLTCDYESPLYTDYNVGDRLKVKIDTYMINDYYRVIKRSVDDRGTVSLSFFSY